MAASLGIGGPFILSVCTLDPRKNLDGLLRAFARLVAEHRVPHQLVLVGRPGWKDQALRALTAALYVADRVVFTGYVSDEQLVQLYNQADLFVYPSKYEGFGLPVLEAMACGVPVVTADRSALREVAGDAASLVDPDSDSALAAGMLRVLTDAMFRQDLVARGLARSREFSWDRMTRKICRFIIEGASDNE
jgi:glycosyltransferase involved in cell wall biosynthesis